MSLGHLLWRTVLTRSLWLWTRRNARIVLGEHAFRVVVPESSSGSPDTQTFGIRFPLIGVTRESFRRCLRANHRNDVLHTHESHPAILLDVVQCFWIFDIEVTVDQGPIHILKTLAFDTMQEGISIVGKIEVVILRCCVARPRDFALRFRREGLIFCPCFYRCSVSRHCRTAN